MQWRAASRNFVRGRGMAAKPTGVKKIAACRCGKTIEAKPFRGQTSPIETAHGSPARRRKKEEENGAYRVQFAARSMVRRQLTPQKSGEDAHPRGISGRARLRSALRTVSSRSLIAAGRTYGKAGKTVHRRDQAVAEGETSRSKDIDLGRGRFANRTRHAARCRACRGAGRPCSGRPILIGS